MNLVLWLGQCLCLLAWLSFSTPKSSRKVIKNDTMRCWFQKGVWTAFAHLTTTRKNIFLNLCSFCGFANNEGTIPGMTNSIILTHWGLKTNEIGCSWAERLANYGHCQTRDFPDQGLLNGTYEPCYTPRKVWNSQRRVCMDSDVGDTVHNVLTSQKHLLMHFALDSIYNVAKVCSSFWSIENALWNFTAFDLWCHTSLAG